MAVLLHQSYLRGGHTLAALTRILNHWDVEVLLADAWNTISADQQRGYGVPVAIWSSNPDDYQRVHIDSLPPPHNLWKHGHDPAIYAQYIAQPKPRRRILSWWKPASLPAELVIQARREQFHRYVHDVKSGTVQLRDAQPWTPVEWDHAVTFAHELTQTCRPWTQSMIETAIRQRYGLSPASEITGEAKLVNVLLNDPVRSGPGATQLDNGQHRVFAAALAGQSHILARTD